jgi:phospholipase/carboxylesterase
MSESYDGSVTRVGRSTLSVLRGIEAAGRWLHPPQLPALRERLAPLGSELADAVCEFAATPPPPELTELHTRMLEGAKLACRAIELFLETPPPDRAILVVLESMRAFSRAQESLYALHRIPPIGRYFVEEAFHNRLESLDPPPPPGISVGLHHSGAADRVGARGGFCLYVPETYDGTADWPLVVALHGGSGSGREFLWTWLREARGRGFLLLAPTATGPTWSLDAPEVDARTLRSMLEYVGSRWRVDRTRVLLTGLSDGATFALLCGLMEDAPFTALAPLSGVLHPANLTNGNVQRARGRRIYLVHGALDWMFPVEIARIAHRTLADAGADVVFREIADLSHTYARDENDRIITWFDPSLTLPRSA